MLKEIIETGKSVEDAINAACEKLGCEREDCQWEIIDLPRRGFLGIKNTPARVKVSIQSPDPEPVKAAPAPKPEKARQEQPRQQKPQAQKPREAKSEPKQKEQKINEPKAEPAFRQDKPEVNYKLTPPSQELIAKSETAKAYLENILKAMDLTANLEMSWEESGICIVINGDGLGAIIGRRGETLDSLQYLSGLVANRMEGDYLRITVDCGEYRVKRRATLEALAHKLSAQVLKTDVSKTLEPMNPFERRIIHATVSTIEGVSSTSIGEEPNRRVVITSPTAKNPRRATSGGRIGGRPPQGGSRDNREDRRGAPRSGGGGRDRDRDRDRRGGGGRGGRDGRDRDRGRSSSTVQPTTPPANPPKEADNKPLYGKIDLE